MAADDYNIVSKHGKTAAASAVSPNSIKKPKERVPAKPDMPEVNRFLMCQLCSGYLIDATAIVECQHTFCKSCILKYLDTNSYCPICDVQLNKAKPHLSLRSDVIIQRLVYKLVPGLLVSEIQRRRDFAIKNGMDSADATEFASNSIAEEIEAASDLSTVLSLDDLVSLSVEYFRSGDGNVPADASAKIADTNGKPSSLQSSTSSSTTQSSQIQQTQQQNQQQPKSNVKSHSVNSSSNSGGTSSSTANTNAPADCDSNSTSSEQANDRRYLHCPAAVSLGLLKKFIRMKYGLSEDYRVDLLYNGDHDSILENDLTLLDVAFIFKWNKDEPMKFQYRIYEKPSKTLTVYSGMKRPAPSVMDEPPPDDDTASGPHNRSSMFSSSSAPSSKLPRLTDNTSQSGSQGNVSKGNTSGKSTTMGASTTTASATNQEDGERSDNSDLVGNANAGNTTSRVSTKVEKEEVEEDDDDDEDEEEDYELVERKEHMKGIKSSRKNSIKESLKRSVAASNLRLSSRSSHSTDTKGSSIESERESRNENSLNNSSSSSSGKHKIGYVKKHERRGRPPKNANSLKLRVSTSSDNSEPHTQSTGSLKLSISKAGVTPIISSSNTGEKKEPLKLSLGSVLASKSPERKHHKHKHHHHHHKLRHRDKQSKGVTSTATVASLQQNSQKPLKISFTLSPPSGAQGNQGNQSQSVMIKESSTASSVSEVKEQQQKGKPPGGNQQNFNNSARTSASAHGHLNNISKSISVSVNTNSANNSSSSGSASNATGNNNVKGNQHGNKVLSPAELIPKNTGIEIQPTTIPVSSSHGQISQHSMQQSGNSGGASSSHTTSNSHKHSHPLLPDSVHVPKSVTLIPVNPPNQMNNMQSAVSSGKGNAPSSQEKGGSGSQSNQNRISAHTFTHPITNKSLHQITVTEVPPPQKNNSGSLGGTSVSNLNSSSNNVPHSSISGTTSNPIEKVIANAANNKPQFNGPGSMEITKIYCGAPGMKENPAKKLKDRKGLDISITGTGINVSVNKSSQKLEETLRQKVNIAIGGGSGSISVTPTLQNSLGNNSAQNKVKSAAATAASLLSGKMPPGITIGPATVPTTTSSSGSSNNNNNSSSSNTGNNSNNGPVSNNMASANAGNNIMKGLGFTLPPHLTAHPHNPNNNLNKSLSSNQGKPDNKMGTSTINTQNSRLLGKDSISIIGKGNVVQNIAGGHQQQQQPPPPVEITISAASSGSGNKSQTNITNRGISITSNNPKSKMSNDPLASILDITQGLRKSPTMAINNANAKDFKGMISLQQQQQQLHQHQNSSNIPGNLQQTTTGVTSSNNKNFAGNKRPFEVTSSPQQTNNNTKKAVKESPEAKRGRSASTESSTSSSGKKTGEGEIPLDLSGRSTRMTPPLNIPNIHSRESSKSPSAPQQVVDKRTVSKSPEMKPGIIITPPSTSSTVASATSAVNMPNNFLSPKMNNNQKSPVDTLNKGQSVKSISVSKLSPNQSSKIGSIVDSLAQKQAQAQQQQQQQQQQQNILKNSLTQHHQQSNLKNFQAHQQQQHQQQQNLKNAQNQQQTLQNLKNAQNQQQQQQHQNLKNSHSQQQQTFQNLKNAQSQQQQTLQNLKNAQNQQQQLQQHLNVKNSQAQSQHHSHHQIKPSSNTTSSNVMKSPNSTNSSGSTVPNQKPSPSGSSNKSSSGLSSPVNPSPVIPMTSSSPPGAADHMRNLWTLNDAAARQGKMNELLVAAGLFSPPGHPHHLAGAAAAHQLAAAAAAAAAAGGSPTGGSAANAFNSSMFAQFGHHLAALGGNKIPPGMFDPNIMAAALSAHNAHAAAAGMRMHNPFVGSMSPPLNLPNAFFSPHGSPSAPTQQPSPIVSPGGTPQQQQPTQSGIKIPNAPPQKPANNNSGNSAGGKSNSIPFAPLFSHSVPVSSPKSPTNLNLAQGSMKSPLSGGVSNPVLPFPSSTPSTASSHDQKHSHSSSGKGSSHHHHHHESSGGSSTTTASNKSTKINGTMSTAMPVFPPGIHNPLLPSRSSSSSNSSNASNNTSGNNSSSNSSSTLNKGFSSHMFSTNNLNKHASKGGIPNSMKISNFLPNKPKDSTSDANAEATITSGSNFVIPPLQAKPNFSLSPTRAPSSDSLVNNSLIHPANSPKSPSFKDGPLSPVKQLSSPGTVNKPSSMTCASLLLPDFSKPSHLSHHSTPHPLNSLSPTKGDHGLSLSRGNRTPSSDSVLLSPTKTSPGAALPSSAFPKTGSNKDGYRSESQGQNKTISPTKDEIVGSKKEIGNLPMGPQTGLSLPRNFLSTPSVQSLALNRPIPTIPAFFNRSSNTGTMSSTSNSIVSHHHHNHKVSTSPPGKAPKSPVKPHLPSPVFPFPGVSVPVQVKLQDEEIPLPASAASHHQQVSLKTEVNKLLAAKEEKNHEIRRRSTEQNLDTQGTPQPKSILASSFFSPSDSKKIKSEENLSEMRPTKVQKVETLEATCSSVKNEKENSLVSTGKSSSSESNNDAGNKSKGTTHEKNESELTTQREFKAKEGEQERKKGDEADPSKEFSVYHPTSTTSTSTAEPGLAAESPCKIEAKAPSPIKSTLDVSSSEKVSTPATSPVVKQPPPSSSPPPQTKSAQAVQDDKTLVEKQTEEKSEDENIDISIIHEEKSETQITVDADVPKSNETSADPVNRQESKSFESGQAVVVVVNDFDENPIVDVEEADKEIDVEIENDPKMEDTPVLGQTDICTVAMDTGDAETNDNQMEIDVEVTEENNSSPDENNLIIEERVTLTKEDEDIDVDVDVGSDDETMEVNIELNMESNENITLEENIDEAEDIAILEECEKIIDMHDESIFPSTPMEVVEHNNDNDKESSESELIESEPESTTTTCASDNNDDIKEENEEEKLLKGSSEISSDVIKEQKLEETSEDIQPEPESKSKESIEMEIEKKFEEPSFFPENETSNLSQDDSECGELVIDLGPGEEEQENDEEKCTEMVDNNNDEEATQELEDSPKQVSQSMESEKFAEEEASENHQEENENEVLSQELRLLQNDQFSSRSINMESSEKEPELHAELPSAAEAHDDRSNNKSVQPENNDRFSNSEEGLNQNSISNQIPINSESIEVNGVIKSGEESFEKECIVENNPTSPPGVDDLQSQQTEDDAFVEVTAENENQEGEAVPEGQHDEKILMEEHKQEQVCTSTADERNSPPQLDEEILNTSCGEVNSSLPSSTESNKVEDNKITVDNEAFLECQEREKNEEDQVVVEEEQESLAAAEDQAVFPSSGTNETGAISEEKPTTPVDIPEKDNNVEEDNVEILVAADECVMMNLEHTSETEENDNSEGTRMDIDEEHIVEQAEKNIGETCTSSEITEMVAENDDEFMQIESDSIILPVSEESSDLTPSSPHVQELNSTPALLEDKDADSQTGDNDDGTSEVNNDNIDVAVISATITTTSAVVVDTSASDINSVDSSASSTVTPTMTSNSSLAIKLDIADNDDDDIGCKTNAESLLPAGESPSPSSKTTSSFAQLQSPSSSSSSSSSPSPTSSSLANTSNAAPSSTGLKSLETFGKVAAGFLASATGTINNNNNNTSLAPTTCDAISIATTNANA